MKVYAVVPVNFTYNDEVHCPEGFEKPTEAFHEKANAEARAAELNKKDVNDLEYEDYDGMKYEEYYVVQEVEVPDVVDLKPAEPAGATESPYAKAQRLKAEAAKAAEAAASDAFKAGAAELFERHPLLESFTFRAYTPYFSDGDPCTYGVYADEPDVNGESWEECELVSSGEKYVPGKGYAKTGEPGALYEAWRKDIPRFVHSFDNEDIEALFGDHVRVTVSYDRASKSVSTSTDDYSGHD